MEHVDHILIVDDDREIRELVGNYLKKNGLRVSLAAEVAVNAIQLRGYQTRLRLARDSHGNQTNSQSSRPRWP